MQTDRAFMVRMIDLAVEELLELIMARQRKRQPTEGQHDSMRALIRQRRKYE